MGADVDRVRDVRRRGVHGGEVGGNDVGRQVEPERRHDLGSERQEVTADRRLEHDGRAGELGRLPTDVVNPHVVRVSVSTERVVDRQDIGRLFTQDRREALCALLDRSRDEGVRWRQLGARSGIAVTEHHDTGDPECSG